MQVYHPNPTAFSIERYDQPLLQRGVKGGTNILSNGGFEENSWTNWTTHTNWTLASSNTPGPEDTYAAKAGSSSVQNTETISTLLSAQKAVTPNTRYYISFALGAGEETGSGDATPNALLVEARWYDGGGSLARTDTLHEVPVNGNDAALKTIRRRVTAPSNAANLILFFENTHRMGAAGTPDGTLLDSVSIIPDVLTDTSSLLEVVRHVSLSPQIGFKNLKYSTNQRSGFKAVEFDVVGLPEFVMQWALNALGQELLVRHVTNAEMWRGLVWRITDRIAGETVNLDYGNIFTRFIIPYPGRTGKERRLSQYLGELGAVWGDKCFIAPREATRRNARRAGKRLQLEYAPPMLGGGGELAPAETDQLFTLHVVGIGMFGTLDFVRGIRLPGTSELELHKALATHTSSLLNIARAGGNVFISEDYGLVEDVNQKVGVGKDEAHNGSILDVVNRLLDLGAGDGRALVSGVWDENRFVLRARPLEVAYFVDADAQEWRDRAGALLDKAFVRAGDYHRAASKIPTLAYSDAVQQGDASRFIVETQYNTETDELDLQTLGSARVDKRFVRVLRALLTNKQVGTADV